MTEPNSQDASSLTSLGLILLVLVALLAGKLLIFIFNNHDSRIWRAEEEYYYDDDIVR